MEFRGIKVGEVVDFNLQLESASLEFKIPVLIAIEPGRIEVVGEIPELDGNLIEMLVERGLRAQMQTGNLLTGKSYIELDFHPEAERQIVSFADTYPVLPTLPADLKELVDELKSFVSRLNKVPIDRIGNNLDTTLEQLNRTLAQLDRDTLPELTRTLGSVRKTADSLKHGIGERSPLNHELRKTLGELEGAARALKALADYLERHPESLLFGKGD